ncbi:uncharacterized protein BKA55DRAFT_544304 [Fusarium redolens]|uniref:DNA 3'-5' helicase n=1 Tax=Fusarium redolens TaxID=48865 RepID=A0A9P9G7T1_FUSRE|nr:uncharacterized protein BKA55DRAFT_544304 [Fusarium redolens]KAH7233813.1 hypothetical protein BKA55DRAFT_544304 [Fusarium redolens]
MSFKADQTVINVLLTGAGKSILFMLPAVMRDIGTSIVVVPFVAFMNDFVTRARAMGIDCIRFRSSMNAGREEVPQAARAAAANIHRRMSHDHHGYSATELSLVQQVKAGGGTLEERTVEVIKQLDRDRTGRQKGVIYCQSKRQCEAIVDEIGCRFHHSGMSEEDRHEARTAWVDGRINRWIAVTTGLGTGIDTEGIVAVVHMEKPYGLVDFVQQTGRGGRRAGEAQMEAFISTPGCQRAVVSAFMDGAAGETCKDVDGAALCDRCKAFREVDNSSEADSGGGGENESEAECETGDGEESRNDNGGKRGGAIWKRFGIEEGMQIRTLFRWLDEAAHECPLPRDWCEGTQDEEGRCVFKDKVLPVVLMGLRSWRVKNIVKTGFGIDIKDKKEFFCWLGVERRFHGMKGTNAHALWELIIWEKSRGRGAKVMRMSIAVEKARESTLRHRLRAPLPKTAARVKGIIGTIGGTVR